MFFKFIPHPQYLWLMQVIGIYMTITGIGDAIKYHWQSQAIKKAGIAKGHSRRFINMAIHNDHVRCIYFLLFLYVWGYVDLYLSISTIIAVFFMTELWFTIYKYYPYRMRGCLNFKRPNIFIYFINSLIPNQIRRRL